MSLLGFASNYFLKEDSYGVLNYFFVYLAVRCASKPEDPTMILCLPIQIKAKWYPIVLVLLFNILFFVKFDFLFAVIIGLIDYKFLQNKCNISKEKFISIENSDFLLVLKNFKDFISVKNTVQPLSPNSEILANQNQNFAGRGVVLGKNDAQAYRDVEKNQSVENLNEENSRNDSSNVNMKANDAKNAVRNDQFLEDLFVLLITTLLFAHFFACMFYWIAKNSDEQRTWLKNYSFNAKPLIDQYLYSLYWSTMTMMTVGYGDIVPQNNFEVSFTMLTIFIGCIIVGYNINKIGNIFHDMNEETMKIQENISKINQFMDSKHINSDLQMRIRVYLKFVWRKQNEKMNNELLNLINYLSDSLKEELFLESYGDFILNSPIFSNNFSYDFLSTLIKRVKEQTFMKDDIIFEENRSNPTKNSQKLYYIISGQVEIFQSLDVNSGIVIKKFQERETFGQYVFFTGFSDNFSARAAAYTQVYSLSRESFLETLALFPRDHEKYCQIKDQMLLYANYQSYNLRCLICNKKSHLTEKCDLLHYVPDQETVILRLLYSQEQERQRKFQRKCGKRVGFFAKNRKIENQAKIMQSRLKKTQAFQEDEENSSDSSEFPIENIEKSTIFERQRTVKMQEIAPASQEKAVNRESNANFLRNSRVFPRKKLGSVMQINENELEFERLKEFDYYFPQGNVNNFIEKFQKVRSLSRKCKKFSKESKETNKKTGYFLSKRSVSFEKEQKNKKKTGVVQSDDEKNRRKSFFDRLKMSPSHKFFHKKKKEKTENWTFYQVATEVTNKLKNH